MPKSKSKPESQAYWSYDELYLLKKEIDDLLDQVGYECEVFCQEQVKERIRGIAIDIGLHAEFLDEYIESCRKSNLVLTVKVSE